ncbi:hypothetical protein V6Z12_A04G041900 [Gossypium hirsutum]
MCFIPIQPTLNLINQVTSCFLSNPPINKWHPKVDTNNHPKTLSFCPLRVFNSTSPSV